MTAYPIAPKAEAQLFNATATDGVVTLPNWLSYSCESANTTAKQNASEVRTDYAIDTPRAFSNDGAMFGLLVEPATSNLVTTQDLTTWAASSIAVNNALAPNGVAADCEVEDTSVGTAGVLSLALNHGASADSHTLTGWHRVIAPAPTTGSAMQLIDGASTPQILLPNVIEAAWAVSSVTVPQIDSGSLQIIPRHSTGADIGATRWWGIQLEARAYPTSFYDGTRAATKLCIDNTAFAAGGRFKFRMQFRPHFTSSEATADFNIVYINATNRVYWDDSAGRITAEVDGDLYFIAVNSWARHQLLTIQLEVSDERTHLVLQGFTAGNGKTLAGPSLKFNPPSVGYILCDPTGAVESFDLVYFDPFFSLVPKLFNIEPSDLVSVGLTRPIQVYRERPMFMAWLRTYLEETQLLENSVCEMITARLLSHAIGVQLDYLGRIVGERRKTDDDNEYKIAIQARIAINISNGRFEDVFTVASLVLRLEGASTRFVIYEQPTTIVIMLLQLIDNDPYIAATYLWEARALGVRIWLIYLTAPEDSTFTFAYDVPEYSDLQGYAHQNVDGAIGGYWANAALGRKPT